MHPPNSKIADLVWPTIPDSDAALMLGLQFQLEQCQWKPYDELRWLQFRQLETLLRHAVETVPYYRESIGSKIDFNIPLTMEVWSELPILRRETLYQREKDLLSSQIPKSHGGTFQKKTSGSTGRQLIITDTEASNLYWMATTLRDHFWQGRNFLGGFVSIRSGRGGKDPNTVRDAPTWGDSVGRVYASGPSTEFFHTMELSKQAQVLQQRNPMYLLAYPSNAMRLARYFLDNHVELPNLQEVITYGELLLPEVRDDCHRAWNASVTDMYSCEEVGYIALQCPESEHYHCQSESVLVEVLADDGRHCGPGEIGKVVLTSLHNFAMPIIRYENLDYAEVGPPCPCGRGSLVLKRLVGRERNMAIGLDGHRFWPNLSRNTWDRLDGIQELQLIQKNYDHIEVRIVARESREELEEALSQKLRNALRQPYKFSFQYQDEIIRHANGKYERFVCRVDT